MLWVVDALSIIFVVLLGAITTYEDIKFSKIRNKWVFSAIVVSLIIILIRFLLGNYLGLLPNPIYYTTLFTNILFAILLGYLFFELNLWSPADAKLFIAFSALVPLSIYQFGNIDYFPSFVILINTFTPVFVYYAFYVLLKSNTKQKKDCFRKAFETKALIGLVLLVFGFSWLVRNLLALIKIPNYFFISIIAIFLLFYVIERFGWDKLKIGLLFSLFRLIFDYSNVFTIGFWKDFVAIFVILLGIIVLKEFGDMVLTRRVNAKDLEPGMAMQTKEGLVTLTPNKIKKIIKEDKRVIIHETLPFAVIIFMGVLITIVCQGNLFVFLRTLIERFI